MTGTRHARGVRLGGRVDGHCTNMVARYDPGSWSASQPPSCCSVRGAVPGRPRCRRRVTSPGTRPGAASSAAVSSKAGVSRQHDDEGHLVRHLVDMVSALVDGHLPPGVAERLLAHAVGCSRCRDSLAAERSVKAALVEAPAPTPPEALVGRLLERAPPAPLDQAPSANRHVPEPIPRHPWLRSR